MTRKARTAPAATPVTAAAPQATEGFGLPLKAAGDFAGLAAEWQRLFTRAWADVGRQADVEATEVGEVQWPAQAWLLQMELMSAQASRMARFFEEALAAGLDLQTRWVKQFEALGLNGLQAWWQAEGPTSAAGNFGQWAQWQQQVLSALRHDVEDAKPRA